MMILSVLLFAFGCYIIVMNYLCVIYKRSLGPFVGGAFCSVGIWLFPTGQCEFFDTWRTYFCVLPFIIDISNFLTIWAVLIELKILPEPKFPPKK